MTAPEISKPARVDAAGIDAFVRERLQNPHRRQPLVVISMDRGTYDYLVSPEDAAERFARLADVVALADGGAGWELSKLVGGRLSCYWGAVRLYQPGFDSRTSKAYEHRVWLSRRIKTLGPDRVIDEIAEVISPGLESVSEGEDERAHPEPALRVAELEAALAEVNRKREEAEQARDEAVNRATQAEKDSETIRQRLEEAERRAQTVSAPSRIPKVDAAPFSIREELGQSAPADLTTLVQEAGEQAHCRAGEQARRRTGGSARGARCGSR